jgi:hypothetical protein
MYHRMAFGPFEVDVMSAAFEMALTTAAIEAAAPPNVNGHALRRRIASGIVAAARDGVVDVEDLATEGLRALTATAGAQPTK